MPSTCVTKSDMINMGQVERLHLASVRLKGLVDYASKDSYFNVCPHGCRCRPRFCNDSEYWRRDLELRYELLVPDNTERMVALHTSEPLPLRDRDLRLEQRQDICGRGILGQR